MTAYDPPYLISIARRRLCVAEIDILSFVLTYCLVVLPISITAIIEHYIVLSQVTKVAL